MQTINLKQTSLTVSRACFGTMTFGKQTGEADAVRMVDRCIEAGVNFFDTANVYNAGSSETILGKALAGRRASVVLASKVRGKMGDAPDEVGLSRAAILKAIDASLGRLKTDYLDLYYLHQPDYDTPIEESLETVAALIKAGKVRYIAISNYASWQVAQMFWLSERRGWAPPSISQPMYNLLARGIEQEFLPMAKELGVSTVVYNPLAGGLLTGKQPRETPLPGTRFDNNRMYLDRYWHPDYFDAVEELLAISARAGRSLPDLALSWLLHHTAADCVILGASRIEQLEENLKAFAALPLDSDSVTAIDQVWAKLRGVTPKYNR